MIAATQIPEKQQYIASIWIKDLQHVWHFLGERRLFAESLNDALRIAKEENKLERNIDYKVRVREAGQSRLKVRGWK